MKSLIKSSGPEKLVYTGRTTIINISGQNDKYNFVTGETKLRSNLILIPTHIVFYDICIILINVILSTLTLMHAWK